MNKVSFFTLPFIGSLTYFFLSCFLWLGFFFVQYNYEFSYYILIYFFRNNLIDTLWFFSMLSLVLYYINVHIVNKINIILLFIMITIFSIVTAIIEQKIFFHTYELHPYLNILINISSTIFYFLLFSLLIYYLTNFLGKYFIKNKQPFAFTVTNSSNIHFILFSTIAGFILLEGYKLIITAFELLGIYASSTFLMLVYSAAVLLGLGLSRRNFRKTFDKIQSEKFIKSIFVSSMLIFITVIIDFNFIFNVPIEYYINANTFLILGRSIILILLLILAICLILNKVTKHYFLTQE